MSAMEHHSNIVPWQLVCEPAGARLRVAPIDDRGALILEEFERLLGPRTRLVSITHMSNALGTVNPVREIVAHCPRRTACRCCSTDRRRRITCRVDVQALDCDFYALTGHKLYGPTGIGVLYGKAERCSTRCRRTWAAAT